MNKFVFLGPSLASQEAEKILSAVYLPPVAMGDVYNLVQYSAKPGDVILIIDGVFEQVPAVWHKEILHALARGIHVYGASSMGALRAAELHGFGMQGLGDIFEWFRSGEINDDDEVAVTHGPAESGYKSLSEAMVNIRAALREAQSTGIISLEFETFLQSQAKAMFYPDRSWSVLITKAREKPEFCYEIARFQQFLQTRKPNQKREDAISALRYIAALVPDALAPFKADFEFEETSFWIGLTRTATQSGGRSSRVLVETTHTTTAHLKTRITQWEVLRSKGLIRFLISRLGDELQIGADEYREQLKRFCRAEKVHSATALAGWLEQHRMDKSELTGILQTRAKIQLLLERHLEEIEYFAVTESKLDGTYRQAEEQTLHIQNTLADLGVAKPSLQHAGIDADGLQEWYETKIQRKVNFSEGSLADIGFSSARELINILLGQYMCELREGIK